VKASGLYLEHYYRFNPDLITRGSADGPIINDPVYVDPSASVHPSAKVLYFSFDRSCKCRLDLTCRLGPDAQLAMASA